jgi:hypothetical protein
MWVILTAETPGQDAPLGSFRLSGLKKLHLDGAGQTRLLLPVISFVGIAEERL